MKKILLVCSAGMSTSLLVSKMQKEAESRGLEISIQAIPQSEVHAHVGKCDAALLGPQIRFNLDSVKSMLKVPTEVIDMRIYGTADGAKALDFALGMLE